jgi:aminoglycoside phosphotransferase (APT) family kinase protein
VQPVSDVALASRLLGYLRECLDQRLDYAPDLSRLGGGLSSAEVFGFGLAGAPPAWSGPLVLRLLASHSDPDQAQLEEAVQNGLASQGFPAPRVLVGDHTGRVLGRPFLVMERMEGAPLLAGIRPTTMLWQGPQLGRRLPDILARAALRLHACDPSPVLAELERQGLGPDALVPQRWIQRAQAAISRWDLPGLQPGVDWARRHAPPTSAAAVICHGDLGPENLFGTITSTTGVIDWTLAAFAPREYDVGFTVATLELAPIQLPAFMHRLVGLATKRLARGFQHLYAQGARIDQKLVDYYRALRCLDELAEVSAYRTAQASGRTSGHRVRPAWDAIVNLAVQYFQALTDITIRVPSRPAP